MRLAIAALLLWSSVAFARSEKSLAYPRDPAWQAAVRFIRVDQGLKVIEKDADAGYLIFELKEEKKTFRGSLEVIETTRDGRKTLRFIVTIADRPEWVEVEMLTRLEQKLRAELGSPNPGPTPQPKKDPEKPAPPASPAPAAPPKDDGPPVSATP
jgi:hypothetical protein